MGGTCNIVGLMEDDSGVGAGPPNEVNSGTTQFLAVASFDDSSAVLCYSDGGAGGGSCKALRLAETTTSSTETSTTTETTTTTATTTPHTTTETITVSETSTTSFHTTTETFTTTSAHTTTATTVTHSPSRAGGFREPVSRLAGGLRSVACGDGRRVALRQRSALNEIPRTVTHDYHLSTCVSQKSSRAAMTVNQ